MRYSPVVMDTIARTVSAAAAVGCLVGGSCLMGSALPSRARADDMAFDMKETGQPQATSAPAEGPPSETLANGLRLYQGERYPEASVQFQRQQRLAAEANLDRQRRLFALGVTTKSQVKRAEEKVATLPPR